MQVFINIAVEIQIPITSHHNHYQLTQLGGKGKITTKQIVVTFIQSVIAIDKHELVFILIGEEKASYQYIKNNRDRLVNKTAIINGKIHLDRIIKPEGLHYKVVMI